LQQWLTHLKFDWDHPAEAPLATTTHLQSESEEDVALPKTANFRDVMIPESLVMEIETWCEVSATTEGPLFLVDGQPPSNWGRALRPACQKVGIQSISLYGLRRANATMLMEAGVPLGVIADQRGNSIEVLVKHYLGSLQGSRDLAPSKLESLWAGA